MFQRHLTGAKIGGPEQITAALFMAQRDVAGAACLNAKGNADKFGAHFVEAGGFGIHGDMASLADGGDPEV